MADQLNDDITLAAQASRKAAKQSHISFEKEGPERVRVHRSMYLERTSYDLLNEAYKKTSHKLYPLEVRKSTLWHKEKEQALVKGKQFKKRPPAPPGRWNKSVTLYAGMWKQRTVTGIPAQALDGDKLVLGEGTDRRPRIAGRLGNEEPTACSARQALVVTYLCGKELFQPWYGERADDELIRGKGVFRYSRYKAWEGGIVTCQVSPRDTGRECAVCKAQVTRYGETTSGHPPGAPLVLCSVCGMRGNADRNASLNIGQRLFAR